MGCAGCEIWKFDIPKKEEILKITCFVCGKFEKTLFSLNKAPLLCPQYIHKSIQNYLLLPWLSAYLISNLFFVIQSNMSSYIIIHAT